MLLPSFLKKKTHGVKEDLDKDPVDCTKQQWDTHPDLTIPPSAGLTQQKYLLWGIAGTKGASVMEHRLYWQWLIGSWRREQGSAAPSCGCKLLWEGKQYSKQKQINKQAHSTVMALGSLFYWQKM